MNFNFPFKKKKIRVKRDPLQLYKLCNNYYFYFVTSAIINKNKLFHVHYLTWPDIENVCALKGGNKKLYMVCITVQHQKKISKITKTKNTIILKKNMKQNINYKKNKYFSLIKKNTLVSL